MSPVEQEQRADADAREEKELLSRLRAGDERAFESLVKGYHGTMIAIAGNYVRTRAVAEEVVQDAWLGVVNGLDRFEGRSSLRTWILKILVNTAMGRGTREAAACPSRRWPPLMTMSRGRPRALPPSGQAFAGNWTAFPGDWSLLPEEKLLGRETLEIVKARIEEPPGAQRTVITMRDVAG